MTKYWVAVASKEHVEKGVADGFAQVCHGKQTPLKRIQQGDWMIYYSPVEIFGGKQSCRKFTALGQVQDMQPYQFAMSSSFIPWRRNVHFLPVHDAAIEPLIDQLNFIENKIYWGFKFRFGLFEIGHEDFLLITNVMGVVHEK